MEGDTHTKTIIIALILILNLGTTARSETIAIVPFQQNRFPTSISTQTQTNGSNAPPSNTASNQRTNMIIG